MVPRRRVRPTQTWVGRTGALLAVASAAVHAAGLPGHESAQLLILAAMTIGCLYCAWHLWTRATIGDWALVAIMNVGMIAVHQNMSMPASHSGHGLAASTSHTVSTMPAPSAAMTIAAVEVVFATVVLFATTRPRSVRELHRVPVLHDAPDLATYG